MNNYIALLNHVMKHGKDRETRVGKTRAIFGWHLTFDLAWNFPATTVKKLYFKSVANELAGFLRAETDAAKMGSGIWLQDAKRWHEEPGSLSKHPTDMGKVYGWLWRNWGGDQLAQVVSKIQKSPTDRRLLVSAWDPDRMDEGCLPPCHYAFQFFVQDKKLSCMFNMRSVDCFLGLPFDIASYSLLTHIVAQQSKLGVYQLHAMLGDTHIYHNHFDGVIEACSRQVLPGPKLKLAENATIDNFTADMAELIDYKHHPAIKVDLNV